MPDENPEKREQVERQVEKIEKAVEEIKRLGQDRDLTDASRPPGRPTTPPPTRRPREED